MIITDLLYFLKYVSFVESGPYDYTQLFKPCYLYFKSRSH